MRKTYVVATMRPWNIKIFYEVISRYPGTWHLITDVKDLTVKRLKAIAPRYIFFPHWGHVVSSSILRMAECVCFHETDVPFGRGGSPIQNLIARGHRETKISALRMTQEVDAGPVYMKRALSLEGSAEEIFVRSSGIVAEMIREIIRREPQPEPQKGKVVTFRRRTPAESRIPDKGQPLGAFFDHVRMLDAEEYPRAFFEYGGFRYEFSRPVLRTGAIVADVRITPLTSRRTK